MTATYQIRVFVILDDLTQEGMRGWNTIEHKVEIRGDVTPTQANELVNKITEMLKKEAQD